MQTAPEAFNHHFGAQFQMTNGHQGAGINEAMLAQSLLRRLIGGGFRHIETLGCLAEV
jgi:hypothetical protein